MNDLTQIDRLHTEWQALQPLKSEDEQRLWKKLRLEWNYHSNHIEGNTLTYGETASLLIHDQAVGDHDLRNYMEMKAHDLAIEHLRTMVKEDRPLTEADIRDLNRILLKEPFWKEAVTADGQASRIQIIPGQYKEQPNNVRTADGGIFKFTPPSEVPASMATLIENYRQTIKEGKTHTVEIASKLHHDFVLIHPFGDGNGRTARLLVNYILMCAGYPPIIVPSPEKDRYLATLRQADAGDLQPLIDYLATCTTRALERGILAGKGESIEESDDLAKQIEVFKKQQNSSKKEAVQKSAESLRAVYQHSIKPLFEEFTIEHQRLDALFMKSEIELIGIHGQQGNSWQTQIENHLSSSNVENLTSFGLIYHFKMFKGSAKMPFSIDAAILIHLEDYQYGFEQIHIDIPNKLYSEPISESERHAIVKEILEFSFEEIKKQSSTE